MSRFIRDEDIRELAEVLLGTEDSIEIGLSQVGIDPDDLSDKDIRQIKRELRDAGLKYDRDLNEWISLSL